MTISLLHGDIGVMGNMAEPAPPVVGQTTTGTINFTEAAAL